MPRRTDRPARQGLQHPLDRLAGRGDTRILTRGGVFLYPRDSKDPAKEGRLRLLYEANPVAMLVEQAGGLATTGHHRILEVQPRDLHQRIGLVFGSREEVERIEKHHAESLGDVA